MSVQVQGKQQLARDPLQEERALVMKGNYAVKGQHMTRQRIDQVIKKMKEDGQIPDAATFETDLARRALVGILKPIYQPFHDYIFHDVNKGRQSVRNMRDGDDPSDPLYQGLHQYLMEHSITEQDVLNYIKFRKDHPEEALQLQNQRLHDMYGRHSIFRYNSPENPFTRPL